MVTSHVQSLPDQVKFSNKSPHLIVHCAHQCSREVCVLRAPCRLVRRAVTVCARKCGKRTAVISREDDQLCQYTSFA
ncbi:jg1462 [Pararge aegeria aegeria]|uniref:Jg1462 protein n=1 Tax=Pararge aegeria aegeria TaxID=348720 RepID=A0A8S4QII1_9NEOP|nr:jg1462 [Pararge aegeria aegeria]